MSRDPRPISEALIHQSIIDLLHLKAHRRLIFYHCPNGEDRNPRVGAKLRLMGVLPGVPDLCFVLPSGFAAFMEVKTAKGRLSPEQIAFRDACEAVGCPWALVRSLDEAERVLKHWGALWGSVGARAA